MDAERRTNKHMLKIKDLNKNIKSAQKASSDAITLVLNEARQTIGEDKYPQWKDLMSRLLKARLQGDTDKIKGLTKDLETLVGGNEV